MRAVITLKSTEAMGKERTIDGLVSAFSGIDGVVGESVQVRAELVVTGVGVGSQFGHRHHHHRRAASMHDANSIFAQGGMKKSASVSSLEVERNYMFYVTFEHDGRISKENVLAQVGLAALKLEEHVPAPQHGDEANVTP